MSRWFPGVALMAGALLGSAPGIGDLFRNKPVTESAGIPGASGDVESPPPAEFAIREKNPEPPPGQVAAPPGPNAVKDHSAEREQVVVSEGLVLERRYASEDFLGYEVLRNTVHPGLRAGDVIAAIDGQPVEATAAGGELLIIGLLNHNAEIQLAARSE